MRAKPVASAWLTPREAALMIGWTDANATLRLTRTIRRAEDKCGQKVLQIIPGRHKTRLMVTRAGLSNLLPNLFTHDEEYLPRVIAERFEKVDDQISGVAKRGSANGGVLRDHARRLSALEAAIAKLTATKLRVVK